MKHMDGGQIDGQEITVAPILLQKHRPLRRLSPARRGWSRTQRSFRTQRPRRRSRSPLRRRRRSNSSDSSR